MMLVGVKSQAHNSLRTGPIVGIVLGSVGGVVLLGVAVFFLPTWVKYNRLPRLNPSQRSFQKFDNASTQA